MKKNYLITPGPSPVPPLIREALGREIIHHRTEEFREILRRVEEGLKYIFCTQSPVLILTSSGTGAMEASVANFFSPTDKVIAVVGGKFGERWKEIAQSYNLEVIEYRIDWGRAPDPGQIKMLIDKNEDTKAVLTTLCETSTGTVYDIKSIAEVTREKGVLLIVDAISGLGQDKLLTDEWGVDVVVAASQKGLMLPPGLAFISISRKAQNFLEKATLPRYYFDLRKALKSYENNDTPYTPAVSLISGLEVALEMIKSEGLEERWKKFAKLAEATRQAMRALGLALFSHSPSCSLTAVSSPQNIKSSELVKILRKEFGLSIAKGQAEYKDKIFRIAHMGWINEDDLIVCISFLERGLKKLGYSFELGAGVKKFQELIYA